MRNPITLTIILVSLLSGCTVAPSTAPQPEREVRLAAPKAVSLKKATATQRVLPSKPRQLAPQATGNSDTPAEAAAEGTASATATAAAAEAAAPTGSGPTLLKLLDGPASTVSVIPIMDDEGAVERLMFRNGLSTLSWQVEASQGAAPLQAAAVSLEIRPLAGYQPPMMEPDASAPVGLFEALELPPTVLTMPPADLELPGTFAPGATQKLVIDLESPVFVTFLEESFGIAEFSLALTFLDADGQPLTNERGKPFTLKHTVKLL